MAKHGGWTADAVLAALLTPSQANALIAIAEDESRFDLRGEFAAEYDRHPDWGQVAFQYDRCNDRRHLQVTGLRLAEGVTYASPTERSYAVLDEAQNRHVPNVVEFKAHIRVVGAIPPETILCVLPGRHASVVINHPALGHPEHIITWAGRAGKIGAWDGFNVLIDTVAVPFPGGDRPDGEVGPERR